MNIEQARQVTVEIFNHDPSLVVCWVGGSGLGKTTQAKQLPSFLHKTKEFIYAPIRTEDAMGMNLPSSDRSEMSFTPHSRLARAIQNPAVVYLDELNRVERYTRAALMELLGERTVGGIPLHPETNLLLTLNDESDAYDTIEGDKAFKTRVIPIPVRIDHELSKKYAIGKGFAQMAAYIQSFPETLNEELTWSIKPDTRFLEYLNRVALIESIDMALSNEIMYFALGKKFAIPFLRAPKTTKKDKLAHRLKIEAGTDFINYAKNVYEELALGDE